jgi:hypothetical protein
MYPNAVHNRWVGAPIFNFVDTIEEAGKGESGDERCEAGKRP